MSDYVRVMIAVAAHWRVLRALGPAAALAGLPVLVSVPAQPKHQPVEPLSNARKSRKGGAGRISPKNRQKAWK